MWTLIGLCGLLGLVASPFWTLAVLLLAWKTLAYWLARALGTDAANRRRQQHARLYGTWEEHGVALWANDVTGGHHGD